MAVNGIEPTINLRLAQAYGTRALHARPSNAITPVRPIGNGGGSTDGIGVGNVGGNGDGFDGGLSVKAATLLVRQQIDTFARTAIAPKVLRVVGGRVPNSIDFTSHAPNQALDARNTAQAGPVPLGNPLPLYRHPADHNDAATRINLGGLIDINA